MNNKWDKMNKNPFRLTHNKNNNNNNNSNSNSKRNKLKELHKRRI